MEVERGMCGDSAHHMLRGGFPGNLGFRGWKEPPASAPCPPVSLSPESPPSPGSIEHRVSRLDTLAGVAIRYGVEVSDIRRMNGLGTDLQMFAHRKLQIPLPGRHPPSPTSSDGSPTHGHRDDLQDQLFSFRLKSQQRRISLSMSSIQRYHSLTDRLPNCLTKEFVYADGKADKKDGDEPLSTCPPQSGNPGRDSLHRRSKSLANGINLQSGVLDEKNMAISDVGDDVEFDRFHSERSVRRRMKADVEPPDLLIQEERGEDFRGRSGKGLTPRVKTGSSRTDTESACSRTMRPGDHSMSSGFNSPVRKSSSTSNLQGSDRSCSRPTTKWTFSADTIAKPILEGLPNPLTCRRNKEALD